MYLIRTVCVL